ncbi:MAG TPA: SPOR domain-containing protein [Gallionellaceae bacterium]
MATNGGRRSSAPGNNSSLILGILIGMVAGLAVAGGVAWHISKRPTVFTSKESHESPAATPAVSTAPASKPPVTAAAPQKPAASGVPNDKRFTFYEILPDKETASNKTAGRAAGNHAATTPPKEAPKENSKPAAAAAYFLQAGSFSSSDDANKLKEKLALLGMESNVQPAEVPGKGTWYRVRLGPYRSPDELNKAKDSLKQNGINDAAQVRAQ